MPACLRTRQFNAYGVEQCVCMCVCDAQLDSKKTIVSLAWHHHAHMLYVHLIKVMKEHKACNWRAHALVPFKTLHRVLQNIAPCPSKTLHRVLRNIAPCPSKHCTVSFKTLHRVLQSIAPCPSKHCTVSFKALHRVLQSIAPCPSKYCTVVCVPYVCSEQLLLQ